MIFNKNIIPNNDQAPFLIPGHEAKQNRGLPALADNSSISVTAHPVFVHSVSHPTIAICSFLYKFLIQKEINHIDI